MNEEEEEEEEDNSSSIFSSFVFYVAREVPREALVACILSRGGRVSRNESSPLLTHKIVDRPSSPSSKVSSACCSYIILV